MYSFIYEQMLQVVVLKRRFMQTSFDILGALMRYSIICRHLFRMWNTFKIATSSILKLTSEAYLRVYLGPYQTFVMEFSCENC